MSNPNLVRKPAIDASSTGEVSPTDVTTLSNQGKNLIINSNFLIWQRGTSFSSSGTQTLYTADRFKLSTSSTVGRTISRSTLVPPNSKSNFSFQYLVTSGASLSASQWEEFTYAMEGFDLGRFKGSAFTFSFWVRANFAGTMTIGFRNSANNRSYVVPYTIDSANTWEFKTMTVTHDLSGTWNYDNSAGLVIYFPMGTGSNYQTATPNQWINSNFGGVPSMVQVAATTGNQVNIADLVLNVGSTPAAHSYYGSTPGGELIACQRYYEKSYQQADAPGTLTAVGEVSVGGNTAGNAMLNGITFSVKKKSDANCNYLQFCEWWNRKLDGYKYWTR